MPGEPISIVDEDVVYRNDDVEIYEDEVRLDDGTHTDCLRIVEQAGRPGIAALVVAQGRIALVRTYRYPIAESQWAIPRGFARTGDPRRSMASELADRFGPEPDSIDEIAILTPHSGLVATRVHVFLARYGSPLTPPPEHRHPPVVRWETPDKLSDEIRTGKLTDGFTLAALGAALIQSNPL